MAENLAGIALAWLIVTLAAFLYVRRFIPGARWQAVAIMLWLPPVLWPKGLQPVRGSETKGG